MVGTCHYTRKADTSVRQTLGFVVAISLAELGTLCAQSVACSPAAVTTDPNPIDTAYPPKMRAVLIPSAGVRLNGVLYVAQGRGVHPTAVFLHGFPGDEKNADLAQAVRRAGFNALVFYYRGAWGSPGTYSYSNVLEDVAATLTWLRQPAIADSMSVDPERLILVGHSLGGFAALYTAATTRNVLAVAALAPVPVANALDRHLFCEGGPAARGTTGRLAGHVWRGTEPRGRDPRGPMEPPALRGCAGHEKVTAPGRHAR